MKLGFTHEELKLDYSAWKSLVESRRKELHPAVAQWLAHWQTLDLWSSPMLDDERRLIRYGHYFGFMKARELAEREGAKG